MIVYCGGSKAEDFEVSLEEMIVTQRFQRRQTVARCVHCLDTVTVHVPPVQQFVTNALLQWTQKMYIECILLVDIIEREEIFIILLFQQSEDKTEPS